jgi:hypothetical protein
LRFFSFSFRTDRRLVLSVGWQKKAGMGNF